MNIEQLCRSVLANLHRVKNLKQTLNYIRYHFELLAQKRRKLKLGAVVFEIKKTTLATLTLYEEIEIRYIRQDTTEDDKLKLENRLKSTNWQWDSKNILAFLIILIINLILLYANLYVLYCEYLPSLAYAADPQTIVLHRWFEIILIDNAFLSLITEKLQFVWLINQHLSNFLLFNIAVF